MGLYERDYFKLTNEEALLIQKLDSENNTEVPGFKIFTSYPDAYYFYVSHFPNHMLDIGELKSVQARTKIVEFKDFLNTLEIDERKVQHFIKSNRSYFIIASILAYYDFGHHVAFMFPEFPLSNNYIVDFVIIGKNSGGHEFIFVELEGINGRVVTGNGGLGEVIRKGVNQIEDWQVWLEKNFSNLKPYFDKYRNHDNSLPDEFYEYDKTRMHFAVVAGRREHFKNATYRKKRKLLLESDIRLLHYDNLIDCAESMMAAGNYCRFL
jgi:hypothetical protein